MMLATSAYELAIELLSTNVVAWGRIGDVYHKTNALSKAAWAYQNVLGFADEEVNADQIANANRHLSEQLYADGNSLQAATLYNSAKQYYDSLGISRRLDKQEIEIIQIIEENQTASLPETIQKLLAREYA
jgi:predicted TPR repeat methyltransferase